MEVYISDTLIKTKENKNKQNSAVLSGLGGNSLKWEDLHFLLKDLSLCHHSNSFNIFELHFHYQ